MAFKPTGFHAFWFERVINDYILNINSKIEVNTNIKLPHQKKYANMWNNAYSKYPNSINYLTFEKTLLPSRDEYFRCFLYYYANNANKWKVHDICYDDFKLYHKMELKYEDIISTFKEDLRFIFSIVNKKKIKFNDIFYSKTGLPLIYTLFFQNRITIFSFVIFEKLFGIFSKLNISKIGFIEENKLNIIRIIFDNFYHFVYNKHINWTSILKEHIKFI